MNEIFSIGDFCFRLICPDHVIPPANFMKFRGGDTPCYTYSIRVSKDFPAPEGQLLARREDLLVMQATGGECRYIGVRGQREPYACYVEQTPDTAQILLAPDRLERLSIDPVFCSLLALERRQIEYDSLILHCAYVEHEGKAILFSAPSETGKTTQANLWEKYRGSRTINGDRALLQRMGDAWYARGWPVCGSSGVCLNEDIPIRAIVMLSQAPEDRAARLPQMQAFTQLYSQITVNRWNRKTNLRMMDILEQMIAEIPVYHLACTMEETAVQTLERVL